MKSIKCRFCDEQIWYTGVLTDDAFTLLDVHVRAEHLDQWHEIQDCLAGIDSKLKSWLEVTGAAAGGEASTNQILIGKGGDVIESNS